VDERKEYIDGLNKAIERFRSYGADESHTHFLLSMLARQCKINDMHNEGVILQLKLFGSSQRIGVYDNRSGKDMEYYMCVVKRAMIEAIRNCMHMYGIHLEELNKYSLSRKDS